MTNEEKLKLLDNCILFSSLPKESAVLAANAAEERQFPAGASLFPADERIIGVIARGSAKAVKPKKDGFVTMSILGYGDVFGAATLMESELPPTEVFAVKPVTALVFSDEVFFSLMERDFALTKSFCRYLIGRVRFLTERVECMAGVTASEKLLTYLEMNSDGGSVHLPFGMEALARALSLSRASLYRALGELETAGKIARSGHDIRLL